MSEASAAAEAMGGRAQSGLRLGLALVVLAASCYGTLPSMVRLAFAGGADETAIMLFRACSAAVVCAALAGASGKPIVPPRGLRLIGVCIGLVWLVGAYSYVGAIKRIPIGVAVTIFFMFPLLVALLARVIEGERLGKGRLAGLVAGFIGVMLAVGASLGGLDPLGMSLAAVAAAGVAVNITLSVKVMRGSSPYAAMVMMTGGSAAALIALALATGLNLPTTALSWFGLLSSAALFCVAMTCFYTAVHMIGSVRAAVVCNLEPVMATLVAFLVLGETLKPLQLIGIALVIAAVMLVQLAGSKKPG
ncbi:MAG: DMT family transporter [Rhodospirillales bacterium]